MINLLQKIQEIQTHTVPNPGSAHVNLTSLNPTVLITFSSPDEPQSKYKLISIIKSLGKTNIHNNPYLADCKDLLAAYNHQSILCMTILPPHCI